MIILDEKRIYITRGIPGCGKSTWAIAKAKENPQNTIRVSNDSIRRMFGEYWVLKRESLVKKCKRDMVITAAEHGWNIIVDDMNLADDQFNSVVQAMYDGWCVYANERTLSHTRNPEGNKLINVLRYICVDFPVTKDLAITQDNLREGDEHIGAAVISEMYDKYHNKLHTGNYPEYPVLWQYKVITKEMPILEPKLLKKDSSHYNEISRYIHEPTPEELAKIPV